MKIMGIDIGTTTVSIVLTDTETGKQLARETVEHNSFLQSSRPEQKIQDPGQIYEIVRELRPCTESSYILVGASLCGGRAYAMLEQFYREVSGTDSGAKMYSRMQEQAEDFLEKYGKEAVWKVDTAFSGTRSDPSRRGMITGIGVENFHPGALTAGVICGILDELHEQYEQMCKLTGKKATRLAGSGNGIRRNPLMRKLAEEMFGMPMYVSEYEEEAACGAALCAGKVLTK